MPPSAYAALQGMYASKIGDVLKGHESQWDPVIPSNFHYVIRIDGVSFSNFTSGIVKPFDDRLSQAMVDTTKDLVSKFHAALGYTSSDEISLVFPAADVPVPETSEDIANTQPYTEMHNHKKTEPRTHIYGGRIQKLASITASYASCRFNYYLSQYPFSDLSPKARLKMHPHSAHFDSRVIPLPSPELITQCLFWRSNFDALRNSINIITHTKFGPKALHKKNLLQKLRMLSDADVDVFKTYSLRNLFGTWVKKEHFVLVGAVDPRTGKEVEGEVLRSRLRVGSFNWADWTEEERVRFVMAKLWEDGEGWMPKDPLV
ncbi:hypothetical protein HDV00_008843 [Rhizophlyctis rosea]|nr:hypothetical protein HDV00_008843 [Rhizophlyctis rosea]